MKYILFTFLFVLSSICVCGCSDDDNTLHKTTWIYASTLNETTEREEIIKFTGSTYSYKTIKYIKQENGEIRKEETLNYSGNYTYTEGAVVLEIRTTGLDNKIVLAMSESGDALMIPTVIEIKVFKRQ